MKINDIIFENATEEQLEVLEKNTSMREYTITPHKFNIRKEIEGSNFQVKFRRIF